MRPSRAPPRPRLPRLASRPPPRPRRRREPEPPAPPPVDAGIDGAEVDLETLNELPPDVRAEVERQLMLWRGDARGAARSPPPVPDAPAPKPRARSSSRSSGARPRLRRRVMPRSPRAKKNDAAEDRAGSSAAAGQQQRRPELLRAEARRGQAASLAVDVVC